MLSRRCSPRSAHRRPELHGSRWRLGMRSHSRLHDISIIEAILPRETELRSLEGRELVVKKQDSAANADLVIVVQALDGELPGRSHCALSSHLKIVVQPAVVSLSQTLRTRAFSRDFFLSPQLLALQLKRRTKTNQDSLCLVVTNKV